jgi:hypothetical protein
MSDDQWAEVRQRLREMGKQVGAQFREGLEQAKNEQTLRRTFPGNGDTKRKRQPDPAARLSAWGEQLQARRRQQIMRALAVVVLVGFTAGWLGGRVSALSMVGRGRNTAG